MYYTLRTRHGDFIIQKTRKPLIFAKNKLNKWNKEKGEDVYYSDKEINIQEALKKRV